MHISVMFYIKINCNVITVFGLGRSSLDHRRRENFPPFYFYMITKEFKCENLVYLLMNRVILEN